MAGIFMDMDMLFAFVTKQDYNILRFYFKNYLVAYSVGEGIKSVIVQVEDYYVPSKDSLRKIKKLIVEQVHPRYVRAYAAPSNCGGYINYTDGSYIKEQDLNILAISNLNV